MSTYSKVCRQEIGIPVAHLIYGDEPANIIMEKVSIQRTEVHTNLSTTRLAWTRKMPLQENDTSNQEWEKDI